MLKKNGIRFEEIPAGRHNKIGIVKSGHASTRLFAQGLSKDAEYYRLNRGLPISTTGILSKAMFLTNSLRGNTTLSSFELARGYSPSLAELPQTRTSKELLDAYKEKQAKRAITKMIRSRIPNVIKSAILKPKNSGLLLRKGEKARKVETRFRCRGIGAFSHSHD